MKKYMLAMTLEIDEEDISNMDELFKEAAIEVKSNIVVMGIDRANCLGHVTGKRNTFDYETFELEVEQMCCLGTFIKMMKED